MRYIVSFRFEIYHSDCHHGFFKTLIIEPELVTQGYVNTIIIITIIIVNNWRSVLRLTTPTRWLLFLPHFLAEASFYLRSDELFHQLSATSVREQTCLFHGWIPSVRYLDVFGEFDSMIPLPKRFDRLLLRCWAENCLFSRYVLAINRSGKQTASLVQQRYSVPIKVINQVGCFTLLLVASGGMKTN